MRDEVVIFASMSWPLGDLFHLAKRRRAVWQPDRPLAAQRSEFHAVQQRLEQAFASLLGRARRELERLARLWDSASGRVQALLDAQGNALHSLLAHQDGLGVFVQDPRVAPDNNTAERAPEDLAPWLPGAMDERRRAQWS